jgi:hypothetical protein
MYYNNKAIGGRHERTVAESTTKDNKKKGKFRNNLKQVCGIDQ